MSGSLRDGLNAQAHVSYNSSGQEKTVLTMKDIYNCTGSSRSMLARALSKIQLSIKTCSLITDTKITKILEDNGVEKMKTISELFEKNAAAVNLNTVQNSTSHEVKKLKKDVKDLQRAVDLLKLFEATPNSIPNEVSNAREKVEKAHFLLSSKNAMGKYPPEQLLKAALFENAKLPKESRSQLGQDFLRYVSQQKNYPETDIDLAKVYKDFTAHTLGNAAAAKPEEFAHHTARIREYVNPTTPVFIHWNLTLGGLEVQDGNKTAENLNNTHISKLLSNNLKKRNSFDKQLAADLAKLPVSNINDWKKDAVKLQELLNREFQGDPVLRTHIDLTHYSEGIEFINEVLHHDGSDVDKTIQRMEGIVATFIASGPQSINIPDPIKLNVERELKNLKNYVNNARALNTPENEINQHIKNPDIFDAAGLHILNQIISNSRIDSSAINRRTGYKPTPSTIDIDFY